MTYTINFLASYKVETLNKQLRVQKPDDRTAIKPRFVLKQIESVKFWPVKSYNVLGDDVIRQALGPAGRM